MGDFIDDSSMSSGDDLMEEIPSHRPKLVSRPSLGEISKILANLDLEEGTRSREEKEEKIGSDDDTPEVEPQAVVETKRVVKQKGKSGRYVNQYLLLDKLGKGAYATVRVVKSMVTHEKFAMKTFERSLLNKKIWVGKRRTTHMEGVSREIAVMKKLNHPNVVSLYEVIDDPIADRLHLVIELVPGGQVFEVARQVDPIEDHELIRKYFRDMILGVDYLHRNGIVHADIKPENLLIDGDGNMKLGDFGTSVLLKEANDSFISGAKGTPAFTAPEVIGNRSKFDGFMLDVWAMGVSLYMFVTGICPFAADSTALAYDRIETYDPPIPEDIDPNLRDFMQRILTKNPDERITISQMMEHPWITKDGAEPLEQLLSRRESVVVQPQEIDEAINLASNVVDAARQQGPQGEPNYFVVTDVKTRESQEELIRVASGSRPEVPVSER